MDLSVVIINWNTRELLLNCLASVYATLNRLSFEVCVVDNGSGDGSAKSVRAGYPDVHLIEYPHNLGFAAANNRAFERVKGRYILLLNTDTVLLSNAVETLFDFMERNTDVGLACGQLLNPDGSVQNSFANFPGVLSLIFNESVLQLLFPKQFPGKRTPVSGSLYVDSCIGACMIARALSMESVGSLDEEYFFFFEETDWARRMHMAGWKVCFVPSAKIVHFQGRSVGHSLRSRIHFYRSRYIYLKKWHRRSYPLLYCVVFARLLVNTILNFFGWVVTAGRHSGIRRKLKVYAGLTAWHFNGCPEVR